MIQVLTEQNFENEIQGKSMPLMVEFWAGWCGACHIYAPMIDALVTDYAGQLNFGRVDIDANPILASKYNIIELPVLLFFRNGRVADCLVGTVPRKILRHKVESFISRMDS